MTFGTGSIALFPGRTTWPETNCGPVGISSLSPCAGGMSCAAATRAAISSAAIIDQLDVELPKIFRSQILEIPLELLGAHFLGAGLGIGARGGVRFAFFGRILEHERREQRILSEHRSRKPKCDRDAVRRSRVDVDDLVVAMNLELSEVCAVLYLGDVNAAKRSAEAGDERLAEVVREGPFTAQLAHLDDDGFRLGLADPDGQQPLAVLLSQYDDVRVV